MRPRRRPPPGAGCLRVAPALCRWFHVLWGCGLLEATTSHLCSEARRLHGAAASGTLGRMFIKLHELDSQLWRFRHDVASPDFDAFQSACMVCKRARLMRVTPRVRYRTQRPSQNLACMKCETCCVASCAHCALSVPRSSTPPQVACFPQSGRQQRDGSAGPLLGLCIPRLSGGGEGGKLWMWSAGALHLLAKRSLEPVSLAVRCVVTPSSSISE